jgi:hypothetical protein
MINALIVLALFMQVRIPQKAISHSGRKPITVPGGNRSERRSEATLALRCCQG